MSEKSAKEDEEIMDKEKCGAEEKGGWRAEWRA